MVDQTSTGAWVSSVCNNAACSNGDSITFTSAAPASSALDGTARIAYRVDITNYGVALATPGSRQTPGGYLITPTGGGGTGMLAYVTVSGVGSDAGTVAAAPQIVETGTGYTSCPRFVLSGTADFTPAICHPPTGAHARLCFRYLDKCTFELLSADHTQRYFRYGRRSG